MTTTTDVRYSPLHDLHLHSGAKMIDFHGWMLPVQYTSIMDEHQAVRQAAGLFDISHMGQIIVSGPKAADFLQKIFTGDIRRATEKGLGVYGHVLKPNAGVIDDIFVYGGKNQEYFVVVNSATHDKDVAWFRQNAIEGCAIVDLENRAGLAIQGPKALEIIRRTMAGVAELPRFAYQKISGSAANDTYWACRTGYTGEDGAEFFGPAPTVAMLWKQLTENGSELGLKPCGLGARDTLRLEMGYPLYGQELDENHSSLEANMEWAVKWGKGNFIGRTDLEKQKSQGLGQKILAYELLDRGVPRPGCRLYKEGVAGGLTTSGTFSPSLQRGIGMGYAPVAWGEPGTAIEIEIHNRRVPARVTTVPFYKKS